MKEPTYSPVEIIQIILPEILRQMKEIKDQNAEIAKLLEVVLRETT